MEYLRQMRLSRRSLRDCQTHQPRIISFWVNGGLCSGKITNFRLVRHKKAPKLMLSGLIVGDGPEFCALCDASTGIGPVTFTGSG